MLWYNNSPDQFYAKMEGDMDLKENQAYTATSNISMEPIQCYVTTTPSVDPDQFYATVESNKTWSS